MGCPGLCCADRLRVTVAPYGAAVTPDLLIALALVAVLLVIASMASDARR